MKPKIAIISGQHGNEQLGEMLQAHMYKRGQDVSDIFFLQANPAACRRGVRYIESDMNRSFGRTDTYEGKLAENLRRLLWCHQARSSSRYAHYKLCAAA